MQVKLYKEIKDEINIIELPIDEIKPSPYQQRKYFDLYSLNRLTDSIKKYGVLQPITVRIINGKRYELVSGERRLRAAKAAGLKTIPAVFVNADEQESSIFAFTENIQRKNLSYVEEAEGYKALIDDFGMTKEEIAAETGISRAVINNRLKMLELPAEALKLITESGINEEYIKLILRIPDRDIGLKALQDIIEEGMVYKKAEDYVEKVLFCMKFGDTKQKIKANISDMRIFTNSIKQTVDTARSAGIPAYYDVVETENSMDISIRIVCPSKNEKL